MKSFILKDNINFNIPLFHSKTGFKMAIKMNWKTLIIILSCAASVASCKSKNKGGKSDVTGWNYNDKNMGGFQVAKANEQGLGPGGGSSVARLPVRPVGARLDGGPEHSD